MIFFKWLYSTWFLVRPGRRASSQIAYDVAVSTEMSATRNT